MLKKPSKLKASTPSSKLKASTPSSKLKASTPASKLKASTITSKGTAASLTKTKIIATVGPSSLDKAILKEMAAKGMDCVRINTAHGDFPQYLRIIRHLRGIGGIPVLIDIKGPEIRVRSEKDIVLRPEEAKRFYFRKGSGPYFSYDFSDAVSKGDAVFFDNGLIKSTVSAVKKGKVPEVILSFDEACTIKPNKGVNIPGKRLNIPSLSKKDKKAVAFAVKQKLSFIAVSFTRGRKDILKVRKLLKGSDISIIAKIENQDGITNIDEIIEAADGIMIARGDLGAEISSEKIPLLQKSIVEKCNNAGKLVIVATQMLESMTSSRKPTSAEVSDVANAVLDGADAVMLSGETASGLYPVNAVETMERISLEIENNAYQHPLGLDDPSLSRKVSYIAAMLADKADATSIVCITHSGFNARLVSSFRPRAPIIVVTDSPRVMLQLKIVWGVFPVFIEKLPMRLAACSVAQHLFKNGFLLRSDRVVFVGGVNTLIPHVSNFVEVHDVGDLLDYNRRYAGQTR